MITNKNSEEYQLIRTLLICSFGIFNRLDALKYTTPHLLKKEYSDINLDLECKDFIIDYLQWRTCPTSPTKTLETSKSPATELTLVCCRGHEVDFDLKKVFDMPNIEVSENRL